MAGPLLETKLHMPRRRRGLIARPRLIEQLSRGGEASLTLVSVPAGFGGDRVAGRRAGRRAVFGVGLLGSARQRSGVVLDLPSGRAGRRRAGWVPMRWLFSKRPIHRSKPCSPFFSTISAP